MFSRFHQGPIKRSPEEAKERAVALSNTWIGEDADARKLTEFLQAFLVAGYKLGTNHVEDVKKLREAIAQVAKNGDVGEYKSVLKNSLLTFDVITATLDNYANSLEDNRKNDEYYNANIAYAEAIKFVAVPKMRELAEALGITLSEPARGAAR